ncbi:MAG: TrgA family protein [Pseudomonadota bacterium]|nr:TrgA family protein [Pseudomonadota bacterium]
MPTAAKVIAALCLAFVAWVVSGLSKQVLGLVDTGNLVLVSVVVGAVCGWSILGRRADRGELGYGNAIGVGLTAMAMVVFWVMLAVCVKESFDVAVSRRFHDPMKVIYGLLPIAKKYGQVFLNTDILIWLGAGGAVSGILAHMAGKKWPGR